eukprot:gb/GFBE01066965.1/.p1 GENE.gb/GFBE01066965.1/~~gb/GFBE01066965.1/.p1  ORF type:complete len:261 (+),score=51.99 gb/GFBE01066965.1/:1-783(+)
MDVAELQNADDLMDSSQYNPLREHVSFRSEASIREFSIRSGKQSGSSRGEADSPVFHDFDKTELPGSSMSSTQLLLEDAEFATGFLSEHPGGEDTDDTANYLGLRSAASLTVSAADARAALKSYYEQQSSVAESSDVSANYELRPSPPMQSQDAFDAMGKCVEQVSAAECSDNPSSYLGLRPTAALNAEDVKEVVTSLDLNVEYQRFRNAAISEESLCSLNSSVVSPPWRTRTQDDLPPVTMTYDVLPTLDELPEFGMQQ